MASPLYLCEQSGGRIILVDSATITQVTTASTETPALDVETWPVIPAGEMGDCVFRSVDASVRFTNGYAIGVTPIIDGVSLAEQTFSGSGSGRAECQAYIPANSARGNRIACRVRTLSRSGDIEVHDIEASYAVIRETP